MGEPSLARKNNNPLNLRPLPNGEKWKGQTGVAQTPSGAFCVFVDNAHGVRAATKNLQAYVRTGTRTLREAIRRWAPPAGDRDGDGRPDYRNHTDEYVRFVSQTARVPADYDLSWILPGGRPSDDRLDELSRIVGAMNAFESGEGRTANAAAIAAGVRMALELPPGTRTEDGGNVVIEDVKSSTILQDANKSGVLTTVAGAAGAAAPVVSAAAGLDWKLAAVFAVVVIALAAGALYYALRIKRTRRRMNAEGIA